MAAYSGSLFNLHQDRIEEVINKNIDVILPGLDPIWQNTITTSQGVGPADAIGRDMKILRVFQGGMTGVLEQAAPRHDFPLYGDDTDTFGTRMHLQNVVQTFPDPREGPNQSPYRLGIPMRSMVANIMWTLGELTAEATPAFIGQILAPKLEGFARNISHTLCNYFYINENTYYQLDTCLDTEATILGTLEVVSGTTTSTIWRFKTKVTGYAIDRFYPGQRVDFYDSTGTNRLNDSESAAASQTGATRYKCFVESVDELEGKISFVCSECPFPQYLSSSSNGETASWADGPGQNSVIVYANSGLGDWADGGTASFTGFAGINSWLKGSGNLLGNDYDSSNAIDVDTYPEHKSFTYAMGSQPMTEHVMRQLLRRFHAAKNKYGQYVDTCIASDGVWLAYEATRIGREWVDRTNRVASMNAQGLQSDANFGGWSFTMDGRTYKGLTSCYVEDGVIYFVRTGGGNWKKYVPPDIKNTKSFDRLAPFIPFRFVASSLTGLQSNQLPVYLTSSGDASAMNLVSEASQMPGWLRMQLVPDQFSGMKITGCSTDRIWMT